MVILNVAKRSEESKMVTNKNRNQGNTGQRGNTACQDFRPFTPFRVTIKRPCWIRSAWNDEVARHLTERLHSCEYFRESRLGLPDGFLQLVFFDKRGNLFPGLVLYVDTIASALLFIAPLYLPRV